MAKRRIGRVTTRTGDRGQTKLATGRSVAKHDAMIRCIGTVDELNSFIGVLLTHDLDTDADTVTAIQQSLFDMGAVFAMEGEYEPPDTTSLEAEVERLNAALPPLTEFVLPGGNPAAAASHVCRSVCRRAETALWALIDDDNQGWEEPPPSLRASARYLNRLSDYFFVLARSLNDQSEAQWQGPNK